MVRAQTGAEAIVMESANFHTAILVAAINFAGAATVLLFLTFGRRTFLKLTDLESRFMRRLGVGEQKSLQRLIQGRGLVIFFVIMTILDLVLLVVTLCLHSYSQTIGGS